MVRTDRKYRIGHQQGKADKKVEKTVEIGLIEKMNPDWKNLYGEITK